MGVPRSTATYRDTIFSLHNKLLKDVWTEPERNTIEGKLKRQLSSWAAKISVLIRVAGNEQNPWTYEELTSKAKPDDDQLLNLAVKPMDLKSKSGIDQVGDYQVQVLVHEADGVMPAKWVYLRIVFERKGGPKTKRSILMFDWNTMISLKFESLLKFLAKEHKLTGFTDEHVTVFDYQHVVLYNGTDRVSLELSKNYRDLTVTIDNELNGPIKYRTRVVKGVRKVYKFEYSPGKGGPHDLYGTLYGSTHLKDGSKRTGRDRFYNEINRFKKDDRFNEMWLMAECTRSEFLKHKPLFKGTELNEGFGANVQSRKASISSIAVSMGSPINWCGTRKGAIDDFKHTIRQSIIDDYVFLLGLEYLPT